MTRAITVALVRRSIRVRGTPERAFDIFTAGMSRATVTPNSQSRLDEVPYPRQTPDAASPFECN
jgi:hypothetical protein